MKRKKNPLSHNWQKIIQIWRYYNLSIILGILFLCAWSAQFFVQLKFIKNKALADGIAFSWSQFWPEFWTSTLENWQSEFLQLFSFVMLTGFLIHKGSPESKDSEERAERKLNKILAHLEGKKPSKKPRKKKSQQ